MKTSRGAHAASGAGDGAAAVRVSGHTCDPEALQREFVPKVEADIFTTWSAVSPALREVLKLERGQITCPELGTRYPAAA